MGGHGKRLIVEINRKRGGQTVTMKEVVAAEAVAGDRDLAADHRPGVDHAAETASGHPGNNGLARLPPARFRHRRRDLRRLRSGLRLRPPDAVRTTGTAGNCLGQRLIVSLHLRLRRQLGAPDQGRETPGAGSGVRPMRGLHRRGECLPTGRCGKRTWLRRLRHRNGRSETSGS